VAGVPEGLASTIGPWLWRSGWLESSQRRWLSLGLLKLPQIPAMFWGGWWSRMRLVLCF
jgi:hypothetical protein